MPAIATLVLGRTGKLLNDAPHKRFTGKLHQLSVATFAARFDHYASERFEIQHDPPSQSAGYVLSKRA